MIWFVVYTIEMKKREVRNDLSNKDSKKDQGKISKKRLLPYERRQYKLIGEPDLSQNWLELFTPVIVSDLFTIMHSCSDNQRKSEYILEELGLYGFEDVSLGTNIYTVSNPAYPGVVFKIALDDNGLADNFNDTILQDMVPRYAKTLARHPSAIVSVQERKVVVADQDRMDTFRADILKTLQKLSKRFLIVDLAPSEYHLNYGIERDGSWCFIDASDLYPLERMPDKVRCRKAIGYDDNKKRVRYCGGRLAYTKDFTAVVCSKCGSEFLPMELRPKDKEDKGKMANAMTDGMSAEEREQMTKDEMTAVIQAGKRTLLLGRGPRPQTQPEAADEDEAAEECTPDVEKPLRRGVFVSPDEGTDDVVVYSRNKNDAPPADSESDDDDEEEEGVRKVVMACEGGEDQDGPVEDDDDGDMTDPTGTFTVVNYDGTNDDTAGIYLKLDGDPIAALDNCALPVFLSFGENPGEVTQILGSTALKDLLTPLVQDAVEERDAIYGN